MISALAWVPKGACNEKPKHEQHDESELEAIKRELQEKAERGVLRDADCEDLEEEEEEEEDEEGGSSDEMQDAAAAASTSEEEEEGGESAVARARAVAAAVASTSSGGSKKMGGGGGTSTDNIEASLRELVSCHWLGGRTA
jgi:periodic tryptophan protein 1